MKLSGPQVIYDDILLRKVIGENYLKEEFYVSMPVSEFYEESCSFAVLEFRRNVVKGRNAQMFITLFSP